ncbi:MAG: SDR family NAD(P)-dependent oxidoreductase [Synechococcaceae cyanobacterium]|nr:SDR family NAD(P)-dependent oxidoreductase [Synechococcaceae cyanobacterium]
MSPGTGPTPRRHILITGASSGIGFQAALLLARAGHRLTLPCRDAATGDRLRERLPTPVHTPCCDLADWSEVRSCAAGLLQDGAPLDTLVLNAGLQDSGAPAPRWSAQGFELTVAVNHLAQQGLLQLLLPLLQRSAAPRLVITASEVHDPATPGGRVGPPAGLGDLAGLRRGPGAPMLDGSPVFQAEKAYKDSKLATVLLGRELERRLRERGLFWPVLVWSPGLVIPREPEGFFRYSRRHNPLGQQLFALLARDLLRLTETPEKAGALLAGLAADPLDEPAGFQYWSNRVLGPGRHGFARQQPSEEARRDDLARELWRLSAAQLGLAEDCGFSPVAGSAATGGTGAG